MSEKKQLELKGLLGVIAAALAILSYIVYFLWFEKYGVKLNRLFFISTGTSIFLFSGLLFTFFRNKLAKVLTLFCSIFYFTLVLSYVTMGIMMNQYFAHIKLSLFIGLAAGLIYFIHDTTFSNRIKH